MMNFYDAYVVLSKVYSDGAYLKQALKDTALEPLSKAKTIKICYGVLDNDIRLDYYIGYLCEKSPKLKIRILLKIGMYAIGFLQNKPFAVIDALVELTKKLGKGANAGFVNATLRKFSNAEIPLPKEENERLSVKYSYPEFAVKKLKNEYGDRAEGIMAFDSEYTFVRFNRGVDGKAYLTEHGYKYDQTPFVNLFSVPNKKMDEDFEKGVFTFQSIGSVAVCEAVGSGDTLFDACAAPGGKSVYLADKFKCVTANELHPVRAELIKAYIKRMGADNVTVKVGDASQFDRALGQFSAVLCDVPCSGYGTVKTNPDVKLNKSEDSVKNLSAVQLSILSNCAAYVELGGKLIYSTCTLFEDENDVIISKFLDNNNNFESFYVESDLPCVRKKYGLQFLPNTSYGAGFYVAVLKRIK